MCYNNGRSSYLKTQPLFIIHDLLLWLLIIIFVITIIIIIDGLYFPRLINCFFAILLFDMQDTHVWICHFTTSVYL